MKALSRSSSKLAVAYTALIVDDEPAVRKVMSRWLTKSELRCIEADPDTMTAEQIVAMAVDADVVLLDIMMPRTDGWRILEALRAHPTTSHTSVIVVTATALFEDDVVRAHAAGALDHLAKPFAGPVLVAKARAACARTRRERTMARELTIAQESASLDPLTMLANRRALEAQLRGATLQCVRQREPLSLALLDLDHFKQVNDTYGHDMGDRVLVHFADGLRSSVRAEDSAFRHGGEEFVVLLPACTAEDAVATARRAQAWLRAHPIGLGDGGRIITFSAGVASAEASNDFDAADLLTRADRALYRAKRGGRDRVEREQ